MTINISGKIIHGEHYGRILGFPTANIDRRDYARRKLKIKLGIWSGWVNIANKLYRAAIVIGPIDKTGKPKIEAHLINFKGNLYGKKISLVLIKYLRPFKKFANEQQLKQQIANDIKQIMV